ncbi:MAG: DNA polymerase III subunit delta [Streptosporangiaceae bacterium]
MSSGRSDLPPITLVVGDEELLADRAVSGVVEAARETDPEAELRQRQGGALSPGDLAALVRPSLFEERRVIVIRSAQDITKDVAAEVSAYLADPADDVSLVLVHQGGAKGKGVLETARTAKAREITCPRVTKPSDRADFVRDEVRRRGGTISDDAARALVDAVGSDLREVASACDQLVSDTGGTVDAGAVARYHRGHAQVSGFTVADRAVEGRATDALEELRWALSIGVPPVLITSALAQGLRAIARVATASRSLRGPAPARELGMPPWKIDRVRRQLRGWSPDGVDSALRTVAETDAQVKGGGADAGYALERAVLAITAARHGQ